MKKTVLLVSTVFCMAGSLYSQVTYTDMVLTPADQPKILFEYEPLVFENLQIQSSTADGINEISSAKSIRIYGDGVISSGSTDTHLFIKTPYQGAYTRITPDIPSTYVPVTEELKFVFTEEYVDNAQLHFKIYKYKGDQATYACNSTEVYVSRGDNYIVIPVSDLAKGVYTLEVTDTKGTLYYLQFKKL